MSFLKALFSPKYRAVQKTAADEMSEVKADLSAIFGMNMAALMGYGDLFRRTMPDIIMSAYDINGLFAAGITFNILRDRPALPTPIAERAFLHLWRYLDDYKEMSEETRQRCWILKETWEKNDELTSYIMRLGGTCLKERSDKGLILSYEEFERVEALKYL